MAATMDSFVVIKVKYEETVRRFRAPVVDGEFDLTMDKLRDKIVHFFKFSRDTEFMITYIDEDNDVVTLGDDDDLRDVVRQGLNPLRITVKLSSVRSGESSSSYRPSRAFTELGSSLLQQLVQNLNSQEPLRRFFTECITLMNQFPGHQSDPDAPAHGPNINEAGDSAVVGPAPMTNVLSDNQSEKVSKTDTAESAGNSAPMSKNVPHVRKRAIPFLGSLPRHEPTSTHCDFKSLASVVGKPSADSPHTFSIFGHPGKFHRHVGNLDVKFHRGIQCDGCGVLPITGTRYKSTVKENYDLCGLCFEKMGNEGDYIKMNFPLAYKKRLFPSSKGTLESARQARRSMLDSLFIQDVSVLDGSLMAPSTQFTKTWRMKNNGAVVWPHGTQLVWIGGDKLSHLFSVQLEIPKAGLPVGIELDISVDFVAPRYPGQYISYWRMSSPSGFEFGQRVWVLIQVDANSSLPANSFRSFNLNLPPVSNPELGVIESASSAAGTADLVESRVAGGAVSKPGLSEPSSPPLTCHKINLRELDFAAPSSSSAAPSSSFGAPSSSSSAPSPSSAAPPSSIISYPIDDLLELSASPPHVPASESAPLTVMQTSSTDLGLKPEVEEMLLKDLEDMGFKEVDLNKKILRQNEYDLEKSVDYLCGVSEWDPILEELNEMGFCDEDKNRELLRKNHGSVKRVVMDLLGGENM